MEASCHRRFWLPALYALSLFLVVSCEGDTTVQPTEQSNPVPSLTSLSPDRASSGGSAFTLTLTGSNFIQGSVAIWNGDERATQFVSATQITATILASDIDTVLVRTPELPDAGLGSLAAGRVEAALVALLDDTIQVWVRNPAPGGGTSGALPFVLLEPRPQPGIDFISPTAGVVGGTDLTLDVYGFGFRSGSVVRWDQADLATTYLSAGQLRAVIPAANQVSASTATITVFTGPPGGGTSNGVTFSVAPPNPLPTLANVSPQSVTAGTADFLLTVDGTGFVQSSAILWNGLARATTHLSDTSLRATIAASDIADGGIAAISVSSPAPGGGVSGELPVTVENPTPNIHQLTPASAAAGASGLTVTIDGGAFVPSSIARWNGADRPTTFVDNAHIRVDLAASDLVSPGANTISVFNPAPVGGTSGDAAFLIYLSVAIAANDLIYDPGSGGMFASVPSSGGTIGNTISRIEWMTGAVTSSVFVGSEPNPLARSDDGQYLYVGLTGAASVRRYVIATATADLQFLVGTDPFFGPLIAEDIVVLPGSPGTVAISTYRSGVSPRHGGVFIYDDGVRRPQGTQDHTGSNRIEPSSSATTLYGYNNETTEFGFRRLTVSAGGVTETAVQGSLISGFGTDIAFAGGKVFATTGAVVDPVNLAPLGTLPASGPLSPDAATGKVFVLDRTGGRIVVCDANTFLELGALRVAGIGFSSKRIIRVGSDGVAFIADSDHVVIVQHPLFGP